MDNVLQRMSIVGVILCFRASCQEALNDVLSERIPFLLSSVIDFKHNMPVSENLVNCFLSLVHEFLIYESVYIQIVNEMAAATGLPCRVDPALVMALRAQKSGEYSVGCGRKF